MTGLAIRSGHKKVAALMRWLHQRGGRKVGFKCNCLKIILLQLRERFSEPSNFGPLKSQIHFYDKNFCKNLGIKIHYFLCFIKLMSLF